MNRGNYPVYLMILCNSHTVVSKALPKFVKPCWFMQFAEVAPISTSALQGVCQKRILNITVVCVQKQDYQL